MITGKEIKTMARAKKVVIEKLNYYESGKMNAYREGIV